MKFWKPKNHYQNFEGDERDEVGKVVVIIVVVIVVVARVVVVKNVVVNVVLVIVVIVVVAIVILLIVVLLIVVVLIVVVVTVVWSGLVSKCSKCSKWSGLVWSVNVIFDILEPSAFQKYLMKY